MVRMEGRDEDDGESICNFSLIRLDFRGWLHGNSYSYFDNAYLHPC